WSDVKTRLADFDRAGLIGMQQDAIGRIAVGDIIVAVNGKPVKNQDDLYRWLDSYSPGDEITLRVRRAGTERDVTLRLDVRPN
nr:PDZ domain-containing protein [bacterium]